MACQLEIEAKFWSVSGPKLTRRGDAAARPRAGLETLVLGSEFCLGFACVGLEILLAVSPAPLVPQVHPFL